MSEWLDLMLEEIARKKREAEVAETEQAARSAKDSDEQDPAEKPTS